MLHVEINGEEIDDVYEMNVENINSSDKTDNIHLNEEKRFIPEKKANCCQK